MNQIDYQAMSYEELRKYTLEHREDKQALATYLEKRHQQKTAVITTIDDTEFDSKIQASVIQQLNQHQKSSH